MSKQLKNYLSLIKFSHTVFALPFAVTGFLIAIYYSGFPFQIKTLGLVLLCMVLARNAAMAFNRYIDRDIDKLNPRTVVREIPSGKVSARSALIFTVINSVVFVTVTYFLNDICFYLSPVALLVILGYSLTKRFTFLCHVILGIGLSFAPIGAYIAVSGQFDLIPILLSFAVLFWVGGFDIIYALQDEDFDRQQNLKSVPAYLGKKNALHLSEIFHVMTAGFLIAAGLYGAFGMFYWIGFSVFSSMLIYQHTLVKPHDLSKVNFAFFTTNGIASIVFAFFAALELIL